MILDKDNIDEAVKIIKEGGVVIFPTETVYGIGASIYIEKGVKKIFEVKNRPSDNPLIVHISNLKMLSQLVEKISERHKKIIDKFWPGPISLIFKKKKELSTYITNGLDTVAIRMPKNKVALELIEKTGPLVAPSANISGKVSATKFEHLEELIPKVDAIIKSDPTEIGIESTVLDLSTEDSIILRKGFITKKEISELIGEVSENHKEDIIRSPGIKYKHYSPNTKVVLLKGNEEEVIEFYNSSENSVFIVPPSFNKMKKEENVIEFYSFGDKLVGANRIFSLFYEIDKLNYGIIYVVEIKKEGVMEAVMDRVIRASGNNIIDLRKK